MEKILGFGQRAGKLISGDLAVKSAINRGKVKLLLIAIDAAGRTQRELRELAAAKKIPAFAYGSKEELGRLIGKSPRSAVAFTDEKMVCYIKSRWKGERPTGH
ncbi:MAG: putative ribosomal protein YlxQ [Firmicutes bacterium ADurb.Bin456]|nr:MAG: putative ribosomal protein YlxQ [Firmicutes bacterium ADurb.Bin456]